MTIPKLYNSDRSKLYFFVVGLEGRYTAGSNQKLSLVPAVLERSGKWALQWRRHGRTRDGETSRGEYVAAAWRSSGDE